MITVGYPQGVSVTVPLSGLSYQANHVAWDFTAGEDFPLSSPSPASITIIPSRTVRERAVLKAEAPRSVAALLIQVLCPKYVVS